MNTKNFAHKEINEIFQHSQKIAITTHIESDGDGMVAAYALHYLLGLKGYESFIITDGEQLSQYDFLGEMPTVIPYQPGLSFDTLVILDLNSKDRLGKRQQLLEIARKVVVLDHHLQENSPISADYFIIDSSFVSVGALLYSLFAPEIAKLSKEERKYIADCVYVTLLNDTNNFINANTDPATFRLAAELVEAGAQPFYLYKQFMLNNSAGEMRYIGGTLATIELELDEQILTMYSTYELKQSCGVNPEEFRQATRYVQGVRKLKGLIYFREDAPGEWKLSLRSVPVNVQQIAAKYGGGGHRQASGCSMRGSLPEIKALLLKDFATALAEL
ncbi:MAG: DHH family phosphoesterase [Candidatus Cloacimonetes bacterium]|nr:DHH family phosphoesterase [Candidatus Cloacimonadota bacterium]